jgi:pimeloyl-ACP methyl ester carboxylesterase
VAGQYALTYPDQVQSLVVIAPEGVTNAELRGRWRRDRWLVAPWSPLPLVLPWLGKSPWAKALRDRRQCLRQAPAACKLLFQRRAAAIKGELLQQRLGQITVPTLVLQSTAADPVTRRLTQAWLRLLAEPHPGELAPAATPLGVDGAAFAAALSRFMAPPPDQPSTDQPGQGQNVTPLGQLI